MRPMRVLAVGNDYPPHGRGGYERLWRSVDDALRSSGHEVRVLVPAAADGPMDAEEGDVARELAWYWRDFAFPRRSLRERIALERHNAAVLGRHLAELRPDVVCWWSMGGMSMGLIERVRRQGLPAVAVVADDWVVYGPQVDAWHRLSRRWTAAAERLTGLPARLDLGGAARWIFISAGVRQAAEGAGWALPHAKVVHPGVNPADFQEAAAPRWRGELLYCGRIDPRKGIEVAVEALVHLPDARLTVDGPGGERHRTELGALAQRIGVAERVRLTDSDSARIRDAYAAADAVLCPATWAEPWGLVPLEAMAVGRPVIATALGGSAEYLRDGENCLVVPPGDAAALAGAVSQLEGADTLRERLRDGGRATTRRFSAQAFAAAVEAELETAVKAGPAAVVATPGERG